MINENDLLRAELERLRAAIAYVRQRSARAGEILNEFDSTYVQQARSNVAT